MVKLRSYGSDRTYESAYLLIYEKVSADYGDLALIRHDLYLRPDIIERFQMQINSANIFQFSFSKDLSDFVDKCLERNYKEARDIKILLWFYFFNVRIYSCEPLEKLFTFLKECSMPLDILPSLIDFKILERILFL